MKTLSLSTRIYVGLVLLQATLVAISIFLPAFDQMTPQMEELPASKPVIALINAAMVLVVYGGLGYLGLLLSQKLGFARLWDHAVTNWQRFAVPAIVGIGMGVFIIAGDAILSRFHDLGPLPHPDFPMSLLASTTAGIGEELLFRLFFIPFWVWLISRILLKGKALNTVFWCVTVVSALAFAIGHLPAVMMLYEFESIGDVPVVFLIEIFLLNGVLSVLAAYYLRRYGYLAPVGIHFWTDIVWHVIWGAI